MTRSVIVGVVIVSRTMFWCRASTYFWVSSTACKCHYSYLNHNDTIATDGATCTLQVNRHCFLLRLCAYKFDRYLTGLVVASWLVLWEMRKFAASFLRSESAKKSPHPTQHTTLLAMASVWCNSVQFASICLMKLKLTLTWLQFSRQAAGGFELIWRLCCWLVELCKLDWFGLLLFGLVWFVLQVWFVPKHKSNETIAIRFVPTAKAAHTTSG